MGDSKWYSGLSELTLVASEYYFIVRIISGFFITLALALILPVLGLVVYDIALWIWRLCSFTPTPVENASSSPPGQAADNRNISTNGGTVEPGGPLAVGETKAPF